MNNIIDLYETIKCISSTNPEHDNNALNTTTKCEAERCSLMLSQIVLIDTLEDLIEQWEHFYPVDKNNIYEFIIYWINEQNSIFDTLDTSEITFNRFKFVDDIKKMKEKAYQEQLENSASVELYYETSINQTQELKYAINQFALGVLRAVETSIMDVTLLGCPIILHLTSLNIGYAFSKRIIEKYGNSAPDEAKRVHSTLVDILQITK